MFIAQEDNGWDDNVGDLAIFISQERVQAMCVKFILSCLLKMGDRAQTTISDAS